MSADLLRRAAKEMRERAEPMAALAPWYRMYGNVYHAGGNPIVENTGQLAAEHIASWDPAVAFAVADWLDNEAGHMQATTDGLGVHPAQAEDVYTFPLAVARAYLGETS